MGFFLNLPTKARKDPLGPVYLSGLANNLNYVRGVLGVEHKVNGEHNVQTVPRAVVSVPWSGSAYSISPTPVRDVTAVSSPAVGTVNLTLAANRFVSLLGGDPNIRLQLNFKGSGVATKPWAFGYNVVSSTSIQIFLKQLSSALGSGNTWAAADGDFDIAIHADPLGSGVWPVTPVGHFRGDTLTEGATDWNGHVQADGDLACAFSSTAAPFVGSHSLSSGKHAVREVAKGYGYVSFTGSAYSLASGAGHSSNVSSVSRTSAGICVITYSSMTTPTQCFVDVDYARLTGGDPSLFVAQAAQTSATQSTVYIYKYNVGAKTWALADSGFFFAVHGG